MIGHAQFVAGALAASIGCPQGKFKLGYGLAWVVPLGNREFVEVFGKYIYVSRDAGASWEIAQDIKDESKAK